MALSSLEKSRLPQIRIESNTSCCGMVHFHNFGEVRQNSKGETVYLEEEAMTEIIKKASQGNEHLAGFATLNERQFSRWGEALKKQGWKPVKSFINPNGGNTVHVVLRIPGEK